MEDHFEGLENAGPEMQDWILKERFAAAMALSAVKLCSAM